MPWSTPSLSEIRSRNRDYITARLKAPLVPNSNTRIVADAAGGLAHLNLQYLDWLALQLLPDTAETEWLDRHANIWLTNADGTRGRKAPTQASGSVTFNGTAGVIVYTGTILLISVGQSGIIRYQTTSDVVLGDGPTEVPVLAIDAGSLGNRQTGDALSIQGSITGVLGPVNVISVTGGTDQETDDELRVRVLERIQQPPMGGDADDYVEWALAFPGVTRAWCSPKEMGIGTVTLRFMMDDLRSSNGGFPNAIDIARVQSWIDKKRPVTVMDCFVVAPIRDPVSFTLNHLNSDDEGTRAAIVEVVADMFLRKAAPAYAKNGVTYPSQTIYAAWVSEAVMQASGVVSFDLDMADHVPASNGHLAVLGNIVIG